MDGDAVAALGFAGAFVSDGVVGCDFCGESEGKEEGEEGEEGEAHGCYCFKGRLRWWCFLQLYMDQLRDFEKSNGGLKQLLNRGTVRSFLRIDFCSHESAVSPFLFETSQLTHSSTILQEPNHLLAISYRVLTYNLIKGQN